MNRNFLHVYLVILILCGMTTHLDASDSEAQAVAEARTKDWKGIDLKPFQSSIHHAVMKFKDQKAPYPQYKVVQIVDIAENLLAYQNADGGWPKNIDWTRIFTEEELAPLPHARPDRAEDNSTLDNDNTWSQIGYLAQVYEKTRLKRYADAALRGIDYLLREQRSSGGWRGMDVDAITFNDNVMTGVLRTLRVVSTDANLYSFVDDERRAKAKQAYEKGIQCTLDCQIKVDGHLTAWCEQHDHATLAPVWARTFEAPSITPDESVGIVKMLMEIDNPSPEIIRSIQAAAAWFEKVKIKGLVIEKVPAPPETFPWHYSDCDFREVHDPSAPPIWARYYDLEQEAPLFCNRDQKITRNYADLDRERRTGMPWYGYWPADILVKFYPRWRHKWLPGTNLPVVYMVGDSTAAVNGPDKYPRMGWAQVLQSYLDPNKAVVQDKARGGRSTKSFLDEGAWAEILIDLKPGDYVLIQFGHNDMKKNDPKRYAQADTTYRELLKRYVAESREKGAIPILLTSINRNAWTEDGHLKPTLEDYPKVTREVAQELNVPLIDLNEATRVLFEKLGKEQTTQLFMNQEKGVWPNFPDGVVDNTHLQEKGAHAVCTLVADALEQSDIPLRMALIPRESSAWRSTGSRMEFTLADGDASVPITSGRWRLSGTLAIKFTGQVDPHENTVVQVFGRGVEALEGHFDKVELPDGWRCDVEYDEKTPAVILRNFRPTRAPAFPGAEGFGKYARGGRGGIVYEVTNLNDSGPGSFRAACEAKGPRTVVFRVSGTIPLLSPLKVRNPYLTIAGQTAPGDGICLKNFQFAFDTHDLIVRYIRVRPGDELEKEQDAFGGQGDHVMIDHCSVSWGVDETLSIYKSPNTTVQWCLVSESLTKSLHKKGAHGYGGIWGGPGGSFHHNLLAHHSSRNPRASGNEDSGLLDIRNNVIYNWGFNSAYGGELWPRNWINNYYKCGPATDEKVKHRIFYQEDPHAKMYCAGNYVWGDDAVTKDNWNGGVDYSPKGEASEKTLRVDVPFIVAPVTTQSAEEAYAQVLQTVGCSLKRDPVDLRVINEVRNGTAQYGETYGGGGKGLIDSQKAVGGWPELQSLPAPEDTDHDGMPDAWENEHGLNPQDASDGAKDSVGDGYTNLERYLNALVVVPAS